MRCLEGRAVQGEAAVEVVVERGREKEERGRKRTVGDGDEHGAVAALAGVRPVAADLEAGAAAARGEGAVEGVAAREGARREVGPAI